MTISVGSSLPEFQFIHMTADGPSKMSTADLCSGKKIVLFAVPGAFTPTCHMNHLPGFVTHADEIKAKGVDTIAVVSVNDVFVMKAWSDSSSAGGKVQFLADPDGEFAKATGLNQDLTDFGLGVRSKRYAMIVDDGVISTLNVEESPGTADVSGAKAILEAL